MVVVVVVDGGCDDPLEEDGLVMQQLPSSGQDAFSSMSSQNKANKPLTHSPLHGFNDGLVECLSSGLDCGLIILKNFRNV